MSRLVHRIVHGHWLDERRVRAYQDGRIYTLWRYCMRCVAA